jgi:hypothetical protein
MTNKSGSEALHTHRVIVQNYSVNKFVKHTKNLFDYACRSKARKYCRVVVDTKAIERLCSVDKEKQGVIFTHSTSLYFSSFPFLPLLDEIRTFFTSTSYSQVHE